MNVTLSDTGYMVGPGLTKLSGISVWEHNTKTIVIGAVTSRGKVSGNGSIHIPIEDAQAVGAAIALVDTSGAAIERLVRLLLSHDDMGMGLIAHVHLQMLQEEFEKNIPISIPCDITTSNDIILSWGGGMVNLLDIWELSLVEAVDGGYLTMEDAESITALSKLINQ